MNTIREKAALGRLFFGSVALAARVVDMGCTRVYILHMETTIKIRNPPDALHRRLKSRAALAGMSLSDYLLGEIRQAAERSTLEDAVPGNDPFGGAGRGSPRRA
jgi:hypothetical protein